MRMRMRKMRRTKRRRMKKEAIMERESEKGKRARVN